MNKINLKKKWTEIILKIKEALYTHIAFIYMITHIEDEAEAVKFMSQMVTYLMSGWFGLFGSNT